MAMLRVIADETQPSGYKRELIVSDVREQEYKCEQCSATDKLKLYPMEQPPPMVNCYKCHAGQGLDISRMIQAKRGMSLVVPPKQATGK